MPYNPRALRHPAALALVLGVALLLPACGGGSTDAGSGDAGQNLVLVGFLQAGLDNSSINVPLEFTFSEPVDPASVTSGAVQIREGPDFGRTARGEFQVEGSKVYFMPELPTDCALQTAGFKPGTTYRITVAGWPETYAVHNTQGQSLDRTTTYEFITLPETADGVLQDQIPSQAPYVVSTSPQNADAAVTVQQGNEVVIELSENIDPCSVSSSSVLFQIFELGDPVLANAIDAPNGNKSGFTPATDSAPGDDFSWGASNSTPVDPEQVIPATTELVQTLESTHLIVRPLFGEFPDNALIVVELSYLIRDFGGYPLPRTAFKFTTENREPQEQSYSVEFDATTPVDAAGTTADVNTARSPSRAQGWLLFAGDGDSGSSPTNATPPPTAPVNPPTDCGYRTNYGFKTPFDPTSSVTLNTGASRNTVCTNLTDGSTAVVWEFSSIRIRAGVTVRIIGENPAILLSQGDVIIENGGILRVRGDGQDGAPKGYGGHGTGGYGATGGDGGQGVLGAGDGGNSQSVTSDSSRSGLDGWVGMGSPDYNTSKEEGGHGAGLGNASSSSASYGTNSGGPSGGGGGHAVVGQDGTANMGTGSVLNGTERGTGGAIYPDTPDAEKLYTPSAGSGGGGGGGHQTSTSTYYESPGGAGGAGGGFVDITSGGAIRIYGTIDAAGSRGGNGGQSYYSGGGGGGGGSGGGIRLLTPNDIDVTGGTLTTAGGSGGTGRIGTATAYGTPPPNHGAPGGSGRIVLEDGDSLITGTSTAMMLPSEGLDGFYRGNFDATRFKGGGLDSVATTELLFLGPISPPAFHAPERADFVADIPSPVSMGDGKTSILVEAQGYPLLPDGTPDLTAPTGWYTAGYFVSSISGPAWVEGANPGDVPLPIDNVGAGLTAIDGSCFVQVRVSFWLPDGTSAFQPGPYVDCWTLRFAYDQ